MLTYWTSKFCEIIINNGSKVTALLRKMQLKHDLPVNKSKSDPFIQG